jgi:glyoxylase-like metal-dependent hydrolase (beta-lactamase superfamily II)
MSVNLIRHLNCTTFRLRFARTFDGQRGMFDPHLTCVTHCLLVETSNAGLVLVDTGFSTQDIHDPRRVSPIFHFVFRPPWKREETALAGIQALGLSPQDVRHIILTHLDYDHANGLADFPWATAHVYATELHAAQSGQSLRDRLRYDRSRLSAHSHWASYGADGGDTWYGLQGLCPIKALGDDFALVPLAGHSTGHCGVAVRSEQGWLLHAGDAYMQHAELQPAPDGPARTGLFQPIMQDDGAARRESLARLAELHRKHGSEVRVFCAHDQTEFESLRQLT